MYCTSVLWISKFVLNWVCERLARNYISSRSWNPLGRPRNRSDDNIKMYLTGIGWDWVLVSHDRDSWRGVVNAVMNLQIPQNCGNFFSGWGSLSFPRRTLLCGGVIYVHISRQDVKYSTVFVTVMKQVLHMKLSIYAKNLKYLNISVNV
jgi:hypothetical protein